MSLLATFDAFTAASSAVISLLSGLGAAFGVWWKLRRFRERQKEHLREEGRKQYEHIQKIKDEKAVQAQVILDVGTLTQKLNTQTKEITGAIADLSEDVGGLKKEFTIHVEDDKRQLASINHSIISLDKSIKTRK